MKEGQAMNGSLQALLDFLLGAVGSPYVYGGTGQPCTPSYRQARMAQYPGMAAGIKKNCQVLSGKRGTCTGCPYRGRPCYDCAQLSRRALKTLGILLPSGASSQWKAQGIWAYQGPVTGHAARAVCLLFKKDASPSESRPMAHVGVSLGNGWVVDARGHAAGVVKSKITAYPWTHMAFLKGLPLPEGLLGKASLGEEAAGKPALPLVPPAPDLHSLRLAPGDRGSLVHLLQSQLLRLGYPLPRFGADGIYGRETANALRAFQHVAGLAPDGIAAGATMEKLFPRPALYEEDPFPEEEEDGFDLF